jgi:hypothetical protein
VVAILVFLAGAAVVARLALPIKAEATPASIVNLLVLPVRRGAIGIAVAGSIGNAENTVAADGADGVLGPGVSELAGAGGVVVKVADGRRVTAAVAGFTMADSVVADRFVGGATLVAILGALA